MRNIHTQSPLPEMPGVSAAAAKRAMAVELSMPSRVRYTLLLLVSVCATALIGALLLTETGLPLRTRGAMVIMVGMGLSWTTFAAWVLLRRRVLLARHSVVAARMAVAFTSVFTVGAWITGVARVVEHWYVAVAVGFVMLSVAIALLVRAHRRIQALTRRRAALERELGSLGEA